MPTSTHPIPQDRRLNTLFEGKQKAVVLNHCLALMFLAEIYSIDPNAAVIWYGFFFMTVIARHLSIANFNRQWIQSRVFSYENLYAFATSLNFMSWGLASVFASKTSEPSSLHLISVATYGLIFGGLSTNFASLKASYGILILAVGSLIGLELILDTGEIRVALGLLAFSYILKGLIRIGHVATVKSLQLAEETEKRMNEQNAKIRLQKELAEQKKFDLQKDLEVTATVQNLLFPPSSEVQTKAWNIFGTCISASLCSGDWWWVRECDDGRTLVFCADVTGHGAPSALVTTILASSLRIFSQEEFGFSVPEILKRTNAELNKICQQKYFSTLTCVELRSESQKITCYVQGAPPLVLVSESGTEIVEALPSSLMGSDPENYITSQFDIDFQKGQRLIISSDGLYEAEFEPGLQLGYRRVLKLFFETREDAPMTAVSKVISRVNEKTGTDVYEDDVTIVMIEPST